ncbi:MAG: gluconokinase, GntK/IdnK-type [Candidatus Brocadiaceae bacterium]|nr:gluconokinase, GntK/IdnK-type [Candidatus Brocadiaceae bacterium]
MILMGVSGSGKTTIGRLLAERLNWQFYDGDKFHTRDNIEKMIKGVPLDEKDREPWLKSLRSRIKESAIEDEDAILAVSALTKAFRRELLKGFENVELFCLKGPYHLIRKRLEKRQDHYFKVDLLADQFKTFEEPEGIFMVDISQDPQVIVDQILARLSFSL